MNIFNDVNEHDYDKLWLEAFVISLWPTANKAIKMTYFKYRSYDYRLCNSNTSKSTFAEYVDSKFFKPEK